MTNTHQYTLSMDDPQAIVEAVGRAAAGSVVRLVRGDQAVADVTPPDPDAAFRPMLTEIAARAAELMAAHPDPDDLDRWQRADRLHNEWRTTGCLPCADDYLVELRKLGVFTTAQLEERARAMVEADREALAAYPLPAL